MSLITYTGTSANATSAAFDLKPIYEKAARMQFTDKCRAYKYATKNKSKMYGSSLTGAIKGLAGGNFTIATETGEFAAPSHRDVAQWSVSVRGYQGVTLAITKAQMIRSKDPEAAFLDSFKDKSKESTYTLMRQINRQFYKDGVKGDFKVSSATATALTIDTTTNFLNTRPVAVNDEYEFFADETPSAAANATTTQVTGITSESVIAVTGDVSGVIGAQPYAYLKGVRTSSTVREMRGLGAICSTSSAYLGLTPGTTAGADAWKAVVNSTGGAVDLSYVISVMQQINLNTGANPSVALMAPEQLYPLNELMIGSVRYTSNEVGKVGIGKPQIYLPSIDGGEITLNFEQDQFCPPANIYIFDPADLKMLVQMDVQYLDGDGQPLQRIPRTQIFEGQLVFAGEMYTDRRNGFGLISGLDYTQQTWLR